MGDPSSQQCNEPVPGSKWFLGCVLFLFFIRFPNLFSKNDFAYKMVSANFAACQFQHPVLCSREKEPPKKVVKKNLWNALLQNLFGPESVVRSKLFSNGEGLSE